MVTVGLDVRATEPGFKAHYGRGTGRYVAELAMRLEAAADTHGLQLRLLTQAELAARSWERQLLSGLPFGKISVETQLLLPKRVRSLGLDLIHFPSHGDGTARCRVPYVVTVLDLIPLRFPALYTTAKSTWRFKLARHLEQLTIRNSAGILAISETTKADLIELLGIRPDKVIVTPLAVGAQFAAPSLDLDFSRKASQAIKEKFQLPVERQLLLYVGGIDPRKNVPFLLDVFADLLANVPAVERPFLALVGNYRDEERYPNLVAQIERLNLDSDIRLLGFVPDSDIGALYSAADIALFPSLYEGFGFPVLESMACGTPVIAGNNSSIPEVAGDSALLLPDNDRAAWAGAIAQLLADGNRRERMSQDGLVRARQFSWERTAALTLDAYKYFHANRPA